MSRPLALMVASIAVVSALILVPGASPSGAASITPLDVVSTPVAAEGAVVVITADHAHNLHLEGIAPNTDKVLWSVPYSESAVIPGLAPTVYVLDNVVVDLTPAAKANNPLVNIQGINATTGAVAWKAAQSVVVADQPLPCAAKKYFCVIGYNSDGTTSMVILNAVTGKPTAFKSGFFRALDDDLYQTDATTPALEELSAYGTVAWTKAVSTLMGGPGYSPDDGWDLIAYGDTEVGSIDPTSPGHSDGLDAAKTIGISIANGSVAYTLPGQYQCGGTVQFESPAFLCRFSGSLAPTKTTKSKKASTTPPSFRGLHLTLVGFNPATGAVTWTEPVSDVAALADGQVQFVDATHLVVDQADGHPVLLDTSTGHTTALAKGTTYWCTKLTFFKVDEDAKVNPSETRVEGNPYSGCTANGKATTKLPRTTPSTIGATVDGVFFWQSPKGLGSRVVGRPAGLA